MERPEKFLMKFVTGEVKLKNMVQTLIEYVLLYYKCFLNIYLLQNDTLNADTLSYAI